MKSINGLKISWQTVNRGQKLPRIEATYAEHQTILGFIFRKERDSALNATREHIKQSRDEVKKITLQMLDTSQFI